MTYTHALKDLVASGIDGQADIFTVDAFVSGSDRYDWVFVDEVQDIAEADIPKIQQRGRRVVWAGDPSSLCITGASTESAFRTAWYDQLAACEHLSVPSQGVQDCVCHL